MMTPDKWAQLSPAQRAAHVAQFGPPPSGWTPVPTAGQARRWPVVLGTLVALAVIVAGCTGTRTGAVGPQPSASSAAGPQFSAPSGNSAGAATAAAPAKPAGPATAVGDGTYQVGTDMAAGRYKTPGPPTSGDFAMCYWSRNKDDSGDSIITNQLVKGPGSVTVKAGEFFEVSGGCTWTKV